QTVERVCEITAKEKIRVKLSRKLETKQVRGTEDVAFSASPWKRQIFAPGKKPSRIEVVSENNLALVKGPKGYDTIGYDRDVEMANKLQELLEGEKRIHNPRAITTTVGATYLFNGVHSGEAPPSLDGRIIQTGERGYYEEAARRSARIPFHQSDLNGVLGSVSLALHPWVAFGGAGPSPFNGLFMLGAVEGGYVAGGGLVEARAGLGLSARELIGYDSPVDLSVHAYIARGGYNSVFQRNGDIGLNPHQVGACLIYENVRACVDYRDYSESYNSVTGPGNRSLEFFGFSLGYDPDLLKGEQTERVQINAK
ncbi:MAG: hypothetical protein Q7T03_00590, partial [Deltaproteobacteria bacterium]|nr:hypothetical protein [Deltaproteobacteria bacterium]